DWATAGKAPAVVSSAAAPTVRAYFKIVMTQLLDVVPRMGDCWRAPLGKQMGAPEVPGASRRLGGYFDNRFNANAQPFGVAFALFCSDYQLLAERAEARASGYSPNQTDP